MREYETVIPWDELPDTEDAPPYEWDHLREPKAYNAIADANCLYDSMMLARKGTSWKGSVQSYYWNCLPEITHLQIELDALECGGTPAYQPKAGTEFFANERGNVRPIVGQVMRDRVASHCLNDCDLTPKIRPYLIYDNAASLKGRGVEFARNRMKAHLERFFQRENTCAGYIRLKDQSKYYDNIDHDLAYDVICGFTDNPLARKMVKVCLKHAELDVSDLPDELFEIAKRVKFDRVKWRLGNHPKRGEKYLRKGVSVGDQLSQTIGVCYPWRVDNEATIVQGSRYYARYMDDSRDMDIDLQRLRERSAAVDRVADEYRLFTNTRKTVYCRIDRWFVWLQRKYRLNENGTVEMRILPKTLTRFRRRIRRMKKYVDAGKFDGMYVAQIVKSWLYARRDIMSYPQLRRIELLMLDVYGRKEYEHVYDHHEKWKTTGKPRDERQHVC